MCPERQACVSETKRVVPTLTLIMGLLVDAVLLCCHAFTYLVRDEFLAGINGLQGVQSNTCAIIQSHQQTFRLMELWGSVGCLSFNQSMGAYQGAHCLALPTTPSPRLILKSIINDIIDMKTLWEVQDHYVLWPKSSACLPPPLPQPPAPLLPDLILKPIS